MAFCESLRCLLLKEVSKSWNFLNYMSRLTEWWVQSLNSWAKKPRVSVRVKVFIKRKFRAGTRYSILGRRITTLKSWFVL